VPSRRGEFAYGYDEVGQRLFVFSGWDSDGGLYDDSYVLGRPGPTWARLQPSGDVPIARRNSAGVYDPDGGGLMVFGGDLGEDYYLGGTCYLDVGDSLAVSSWSTNLPVTGPTLNVFAIGTGTVRIDYTMARGERVELDVVSVSGQRVKTLLSGIAKSSGGSLLWDGRDNRGRKLGQGLYFSRLRSGASQVTGKLVLLGR